ncbi:MAG: hypothetical protein IPG57_05590 [Burkholderiales bacterium]|jgi:hypothetical protein|nr:hypothetical protein [Burkholderiales bacterium]MBP7521018.1 hypothetical protein [Leptothrix sp. (in: b-proteobacteria)]HQY08543.1 hypothetical protein [Burkholderiaceae bacterium]
MYLIAIAWMYVALMMSLAEGFSPNGTWLGAFFTLLMYGVGPVSLLMYLLGTPGRRRLRQRAQAQAESQAEAQVQADSTGLMLSDPGKPSSALKPDQR